MSWGESGWTCGSCGTFVPNGVIHTCPNTTYPANYPTPPAQPWTVTTGSTGWSNPYELTLQRIALALERIANVLEAEDDPDT